MTSLRPDLTHVWRNKDPMRGFLPDMVTLPQVFKDHGYETESIGKVFHPGCGDDRDKSWTKPIPKIQFTKEHASSWKAVPASVPDDDPLLPDGQTAKLANESLSRLKESGKPFFLGVGFRKPHLPFVFPERFLDIFPESQVNVSEETPPAGAPKVAMFDWKSTLLNFKDLEDACPGEQSCDSWGSGLPAETSRALRRAYHASASWSDSLVYGLVKQLQNLEMWNDTIVVYVSDHGWKLGEYNAWAKQTLWNADIRTPLIMSVPELRSVPRKIDAPIEHIDVAPTLVELCGLGMPPDWIGKSWAPVLLGATDVPPKNWAFGQQLRQESNLFVMGSSITTRNWKYVEWPSWDEDNDGCFSRNWENLSGRELYRIDPNFDPHERINQVLNPTYAKAVDVLSTLLRTYFAHVPCKRSDMVDAIAMSKAFDDASAQLETTLRALEDEMEMTRNTTRRVRRRRVKRARRGRRGMIAKVEEAKRVAAEVGKMVSSALPATKDDLLKAAFDEIGLQ